MLETALKFIKKIEENGYSAYIVGGFVRDFLLQIHSNDIDICTNAEPMDIRRIFQDACLPNEEYGSITVMFKKIRFEITTFRREIIYENNRKPVKFEYINDLVEDLKRRDFLMNTLCMNGNGEILDLLKGKEDLENRVIHTVGDAYSKFQEDSLRILRAIRFATSLNFTLSKEVKDAILKTKHLLAKLSYQRKKEELNKIFTSINVRYGVKLLMELEIIEELEIDKLPTVKNFDDLMGVWAQLNVDYVYPFSKNEVDIMQNIRSVLELDNLNPIVLYRYGLYVCSVVADIKNIDKRIVTQQYNQLPIKARSELAVDGKDIMEYFHKKPGPYLREVLDDIEEKVVMGILSNESEKILEYLGKTCF